MLLLLLLLLPCAGALAALICKPLKALPWIFSGVSLTHTVFSFIVVIQKPEGIFGLQCDPPGYVALLGIALLFGIGSIYGVSELLHNPSDANRIFVACLCGFHASLTLNLLAQHLGLQLITLTAAILFVAPLIVCKGRGLSIEAAWKFLLIQAFGLSIALLGLFFVAHAAVSNGESLSLGYSDLNQIAPRLSKLWLQAGLVCQIVGCGTLMGLLPMHIWKIQSNGEAPGLAGALFSTGLTGAGLLTLFRVLKIAQAADLMAFFSPLLRILGIATMLIGAIMIVWQQQLKRMIACLCIVQAGLLVLGIGLGGYAPLSVLLAWLGNQFCQGSLYFVSDMVEQAYAGTPSEKITGAITTVPYSAGVLLLSFLAVNGFPPFMTFYAEFGIVQCCIRDGHDLLCGLYILALLVTAMSMGRIVLRTCWGEPPETPTLLQETPTRFFPSILLLGWAGIYGLIPPVYLTKAMYAAHLWFGGHP